MRILPPLSIRTRDSDDENALKCLRRDPHFLPPRKFVPGDGVVLDLGCWIGYTTLVFAGMWPGRRIIATDADLENSKVAVENCAHLDEVQVFPYAIGSPGHRGFTLSSFNLRKLVPVLNSQTQLTAFTVDDLLVKADAADLPIAFAKVDIEGAETEIFEGDWVDRLQAVHIDCHETEVDVRRILKRLDFRVLSRRPTSSCPGVRVWAFR